jgi:hypothetical protein
LTLGNIQIIPVENDLYVINMIAQHKVIPYEEKPIRYDAVRSCFVLIKDYFSVLGTPVAIHMPRIGCGLARGEWSEIEPIVKDVVGSQEIIVYDF